MAVKQVDLYVSLILEDLNNGLTWLKRDDMGYGNIQDKYGAKDQQIAMIRKHPSLKNAETSITVFNIIDDTKTSNDSTPGSTGNTKDAGNLGKVSKPEAKPSSVGTDLHQHDGPTLGTGVSNIQEGTADLDAFNSL